MKIIVVPQLLTDIFNKLHQRLSRLNKDSTDWLLPSRSQPQTKPKLVPVSNGNVRLYHGFRGYKLSEGKTSNQSWREKMDIGTQCLNPEMQKIELQKLNLVKLWKGVQGIDHFSYSSIETHREEKVHALSNYIGRASHIREFTSPPNLLNNIIFEHTPFERKVYPPSAIVWRRREVAFDEMPFSTPLDLQQFLDLSV